MGSEMCIRDRADDAIVTPQMEKTTLGDIDALAALKEKLDAEKK